METAPLGSGTLVRMNSGADPEVHEAFSPKTRANSAKSKGGGSANSRKGLGSATGKQVKQKSISKKKGLMHLEMRSYEELPNGVIDEKSPASKTVEDLGIRGAPYTQDQVDTGRRKRNLSPSEWSD